MDTDPDAAPPLGAGGVALGSEPPSGTAARGSNHRQIDLESLALQVGLGHQLLSDLRVREIPSRHLTPLGLVADGNRTVSGLMSSQQTTHRTEVSAILTTGRDGLSFAKI